MSSMTSTKPVIGLELIIKGLGNKIYWGGTLVGSVTISDDKITSVPLLITLRIASANTTSPCDEKHGFKVLFVLMRKIDDGLMYCSDKKCKAEKMAKGLHNRFGLGKKNCNDGVLFLLSVEDREMYISTGSAVDDYFP